MLKNFFIVVFRNLKRRRLYSFINISGLSLGIMCSLLIMLWVMDEFSYNKFIPKYERLHQVWINADLDGSIQSWTTVPSPLYEVLKASDHRIENASIASSKSDHVLEVDDKIKITKQGYYVSNDFLQMFEFPMINAESATSLDDPFSIVISESVARALFGDEDPINKMIKMDAHHNLKVTGVLKDVPENSSFQFDFLLPWTLGEKTNAVIHHAKQDWSSNLFYLYTELKDGASKAEVESSIQDILNKNYKGNFKQDLFLYPMSRWRLYGHFEDGIETENGLIEYVQLFLIIATLVLIIAGVNFINLMTAQSEKSSKEVGIRKTLGASRGNLVGRFLGESFVSTFIAYVMALLTVFLMLPYYNDLVEKNLSLDLTSGTFWLVSLGILLFAAFISGGYPAFFLSAISPINTLKGTKAGKGTFRKVLTVLQLGTAILLMAGTLVVLQQITMMKDRDLGYLKERLITIKYNNELRNNYNIIKQQLLQSGAVQSMTRSSSKITTISHNNLIEWPGKQPDQKVMFATLTTEYDYTKTMGIKILKGRDFSLEHPSDSNGIIFNKAAMEVMGLENPIGTEFNLWGRKKTLIGVMDNVIMEDLAQVVRPLFMIFEDWGGVVTIRLNENMELQQALDEVQGVLQKFNPAYPFDYEFVDIAYNEKFKSINLIQKLAGIFAALAMVITCLGLLGLISYTAEQRTKEIGIRKVLGASVNNLVVLITKEFVLLVVIAFIVAGPLSWWLLDDFLEKYPIRVSVSWWLIPLASLVTLIITLLVVVTRARKAASLDPVKTLKDS